MATLRRVLLFVFAAACGGSTTEPPPGGASGAGGAAGGASHDASDFGDAAEAGESDGRTDHAEANDGTPPPTSDAGTTGGGGNGGAAGSRADSGVGDSAGGSAGSAGFDGGGGAPGFDSGDGRSDDAGVGVDVPTTDVAAADGDAGQVSTCLLRVSMTTVSNGGTFSPKNIGAVWIATDSDQFVQTLERWAGPRENMLTLWHSMSGGLLVDAITGATRNNYGQHNSTWRCKDQFYRIVPDGNYRLYFEMTDQGPNGPHIFVPFTKGQMSFDQTAPDQIPFTIISLSYTP